MSLQRHYHTLDARERLTVYLSAQERGDRSEMDVVMASGERFTVSMSDTEPYANRPRGDWPLPQPATNGVGIRGDDATRGLGRGPRGAAGLALPGAPVGGGGTGVA